LDYWARTNVEMDALAKAFQGTLDTADALIPNLRLANEGWTVSHCQHKLSRLHKPTLYNLLCQPQAKAYWVHPPLMKSIGPSLAMLFTLSS
jgi:gamma-glutamyltranspeptidase